MALFYITNGKNLRPSRKFWKNISLVMAIRMNQPRWDFWYKPYRQIGLLLGKDWNVGVGRNAGDGFALMSELFRCKDASDANFICGTRTG